MPDLTGIEGDSEDPYIPILDEGHELFERVLERSSALEAHRLLYTMNVDELRAIALERVFTEKANSDDFARWQES
jgi:hypothetical protein